MSVIKGMNLTSTVNSTSSNHSDAFDYLVFCTEYLNIRQETPVETNLKLTAYTVAFVLAVIGNILIIAIVLRKSHFKTTTNLFIINMAIGDVMMAFVCMPTTMYSIATKNVGQTILRGKVGLALCKLIPFLQGLAVAVSVLTRFALAADRYLAIVYPFKKYISQNRAKLLLMSVWIVGALFNAPLLYAMKLDKIGDTHVCNEVWEPYFSDPKASKDYTIVLFVFLYVVPLVLITLLYTALIKELWRAEKIHSNKSVAYNENKAVLKMLVTVIVIFAVCWLPIHVTMFVLLFTTDKATQTCGVGPVILFIGWFMGHINSSVNPIIYFSYNGSFQRELSKMLQNLKYLCMRKKRRASGTTSSLVNPRIIITQFTEHSSARREHGNDDTPNTGIPNRACEINSEPYTIKL